MLFVVFLQFLLFLLNCFSLAAQTYPPGGNSNEFGVQITPWRTVVLLLCFLIFLLVVFFFGCFFFVRRLSCLYSHIETTQVFFLFFFFYFCYFFVFVFL